MLHFQYVWSLHWISLCIPRYGHLKMLIHPRLFYLWMYGFLECILVSWSTFLMVEVSRFPGANLTAPSNKKYKERKYFLNFHFRQLKHQFVQNDMRLNQFNFFEHILDQWLTWLVWYQTIRNFYNIQHKEYNYIVHSAICINAWHFLTYCYQNIQTRTPLTPWIHDKHI